MFYIPETLAFFRVHNSSTTANNRETRKELIDSVILIHDLLHAKVYAKFRTYTTALTRYKFSKLLKLRLHEAYLLSKESETSNLKTHIENVLLQYNFSSSITRLSALDKSIFNLMLLRRKIYQIQKERKYKNYAQQ